MDGSNILSQEYKLQKFPNLLKKKLINIYYINQNQKKNHRKRIVRKPFSLKKIVIVYDL